MGLSEAGNEAVYLQQLQGEMRIGTEKVLLLGDNESYLKLAMNPVFHQRSKHIRIKYHSLRDKVVEGLIELGKVDTGLNAADMLTKNVGVGVLKVCKGLVGMIESVLKLSMDIDGCCREGGCEVYCNIICILMMCSLDRPKLS